MLLYKKIVTAARRAALVNVNGIRSVAIQGDNFFDTFSIKDRLSAMGFRWERNQKFWYRDLQAVLNDAACLNTLKSLSIDLSGLPIQTAPQIIPVPNAPKNWIGRSGTIWYLAKRKSDGQPVALGKINDAWKCVSADGKETTYSNQEVSQAVVSVKGTDGSPISGMDPINLIKSITEDESDKSEKTKEIKGRIPPEKLGEHQKSIETTFTSSDKNIMMSALAGTGKTTMLRHLASFKPPGEKWLYLVFNKKNQMEGKEKFPKDVEVLTSHSFLGRVLSRSAELGMIPQTDIWTQDGGERISQILDYDMEHDNTFPFQLRFAAKKVIKQLASLGKSYAINPKDQTAPQQISSIIQQYRIDCDLSTDKYVSNRDFTPQLIEKTLDLMNMTLPGRSNSPEFENFRDHDDTLWYAAINNEHIKWPKYDVVLADEVQDFNRCQLIMLHNLANAGARIVAVGDENQSIYLFRGSDAHAFENIQKMVGGLKAGAANHDLPVNYRCGKKIVNYVNQNTKVTNLQAGLQHEGVVTENIPFDSAISNLSQEWKSQNKFKEPTAFIGRTNKPLVVSALELLKNDMDFVIIGRDFSKELISYVEKVIGKGRRQEVVPINQMSLRLSDYVAEIEKKWIGKISKQPELKSMKETTESLINVIEFLRANNFSDPRMNMKVSNSSMFIEYLRRRFGGINVDTTEGASELSKRDPRSFVTITTAHRSKGLEFGRVFIVRNDLFPHPSAKTPEELEQEEHMKYVAYTRAMNELHILIQ